MFVAQTYQTWPFGCSRSIFQFILSIRFRKPLYLSFKMIGWSRKVSMWSIHFWLATSQTDDIFQVVVLSLPAEGMILTKPSNSGLRNRVGDFNPNFIEYYDYEEPLPQGPTRRPPQLEQDNSFIFPGKRRSPVSTLDRGSSVFSSCSLTILFVMFSSLNQSVVV